MICDGSAATSNALNIVGTGWLGRSLADRAGVTPCARRSFTRSDVQPDSTVVVASGRSAIASDAAFGATLHEELGHLRAVLDACERANVHRVVVLGSSDVAGLAERVTGKSPQTPLTTYARVKAALEDECVRRAADGVPVTTVRLAPVHGPGKQRTASLLGLVRRPVIPLPGGGRHSIGFVLLEDTLCAIQWLAENPAPAVVAVGGGPTPLRQLLQHLAAAQGTHPRFVPVPLSAAALRKVAPLSLPDAFHWLLRLSLPREVAMEVPVPVTPLAQAAAMLVTTC